MESIQSQLKIIREKRPVIQSITNIVTVNDCANILLAVGASPIMAHHIKEVEEVQSRASGLVINLGATDDYDSIEIAVKTANKEKHPVVLDPVGAATSSFRREFALGLLEKYSIDCIRGNYNEILSLANGFVTGNGLDYIGQFEAEKLENFLSTVKRFSNQQKTIVVASGETDYLIYNDDVHTVKSGDAIMKHVTGMGCMYTEVICAFLSIEMSIDSALNAARFYGECGKVAAKLSKDKGTMTFREQFINEISKKGCLA